MCGRYYLAEESKRIYQRFSIKLPTPDKQFPLDPMYNIAPGSLVPVVTQNNIELMKWGLIPHWAKDPRIGYKLINTRAETVTHKPSFKSSFQKYRCLIPASGFYEWKTKDEPYLIHMKSNEIFSFAGIYDIWKDAEEKEFKTFSIITTLPNKLISEIHDRMPVILNRKDEDIWVGDSQDTQKLISLLVPYPDDELEAYVVSKDVNSPKNQGESLIKKSAVKVSTNADCMI